MGHRFPSRAACALIVGLLASALAVVAGCVVSEDARASAAGKAAASARTERSVKPGTDTPPLALGSVVADHRDASDGATAARLSILTWNLEWFGDPDAGPKDDAAQYAAVRAVLDELDKGLVALEEVASEDAFAELTLALPRYGAVLSGYDWTQKTALLFDASRFELASTRPIGGLADAGRPPLEVGLRDKRDGAKLTVVVVHAKAQADRASYDKRVQFAAGLKAYLDAAYPSTPLIVLGDFNDRLLGSITAGADSPYRAFVEDPHYAAPTAVLNAPGARENSYSTGATIDHVLVSDELAAAVDQSSVDVLRDELLARYTSFTAVVSDHFPVTLSIAW